MRILYWFFFLFIAIFLVIQVFLYLNLELPNWVVFYVNDFMCMPIVFTVCLKVAHLLQKDNSLRLSLLTILSLTTFYALYFELYLPRVNPRYTADFLDVVMYFAGAGLFYFLQNSNVRVPAKKRNAPAGRSK